MEVKISEVITQNTRIITLYEDNVYEISMEEKDND